ncbi:MAG TPA: hypothetical protein VHW24_00395, partial [Bryobacteraceae bacterium]|nr:hypothetical protein [Bryobacteraceae bacterium]
NASDFSVSGQTVVPPADGAHSAARDRKDVQAVWPNGGSTHGQTMVQVTALLAAECRRAINSPSYQ